MPRRNYADFNSENKFWTASRSCPAIGRRENKSRRRLWACEAVEHCAGPHAPYTVARALHSSSVLTCGLQAAAAREATEVDAEIRRLETVISRNERASRSPRNVRSSGVRFADGKNGFDAFRMTTAQRQKTAFVCQTCASKHCMDGTIKSRGIFSREKSAKTRGTSAASSHGRRDNLHEAFTDAVNRARLRQFALAAESGNYQKGREWWRQRSKCVKKAALSAQLAALFAMIGTASAVWQNERIFVGEEPNSAAMTLAKGINSLFTLLCLVCIATHYWLHVLIFRINRHVRRLVTLDERNAWPDVLCQPFFWIEVSSLDVLGGIGGLLVCSIRLYPRGLHTLTPEGNCVRYLRRRKGKDQGAAKHLSYIFPCLPPCVCFSRLSDCPSLLFCSNRWGCVPSTYRLM